MPRAADPSMKPLLQQLYGTSYFDEANEDITKLGLLIGGTAVQPLHTDISTERYEMLPLLSHHPFAPRSVVLGFTEAVVHLAVQKDQMRFS
jgi:hypothetical protein